MTPEEKELQTNRIEQADILESKIDDYTLLRDQLLSKDTYQPAQLILTLNQHCESKKIFLSDYTNTSVDNVRVRRVGWSGTGREESHLVTEVIAFVVQALNNRIQLCEQELEKI